jgi:membrane fusion protein (multidrug efflux system)
MTDQSTTALPASRAAVSGQAVARNGARRRGLLALAALVIVAGLGWAAYRFVFAVGIVSTDDAYVSGDVVQITSEVPGTVIALHADDTQAVKAGQPLLELDPADAQIAMSSAEAGLAQAVRHVRALYAQADQLRAQIAQRESDLNRAEDDSKRRAALIKSGAVSREDFAHAQDTTSAQTAALQAARAELEATLAEIGGTPIATNPEVLAAATHVRDAALSLRRTRLVAPVDGVVAKRTVQVGQRLGAGSPLMAVVPLSDVWVDANFKEVQLARMRVGQPVEIRADMYGGGVTYHGKVAGLSAGSGNAFSLLPPQNATGNWIKIVQRLPVRVLLDPQEIKEHPLRIGLSVVVDIDVEDQSGPLVSSDVRGQPFPSKRSDGDDPSVGELIQKIIADNGGSAELASAGAR